MRKFLILLVLFPFFSFSQKTILWKITASNSKVSYLLGTYHLARNSFVDKYPVIAESIKTCDVVITETMMDQELISTHYNARSGSDAISSLVSKKDFDFINEILQRGTTKTDITKLTPGELITKLRTNYVVEKCIPKNATDSQFMDPYIQSLGKRMNKELLSLETDSFQLQQINKLTSAFDADYFRKYIPPLLATYRSKKPNAYACEFYNRYVSLNFDYKLKETMSAASEGMDNAMLIKSRNDSWIAKLEPLLATRSCFVAVGLFHLYYNTGLIQQLRDKGYTIEPVILD